MEILQNQKKRFLVCISDLIGTAHDWLFVFKLAGAYMSSIPYLKKKKKVFDCKKNNFTACYKKVSK